MNKFISFLLGIGGIFLCIGGICSIISAIMEWREGEDDEKDADI